VCASLCQILKTQIIAAGVNYILKYFTKKQLNAINYLSVERIGWLQKKYNHIINKYMSLLFHAGSETEKESKVN